MKVFTFRFCLSALKKRSIWNLFLKMAAIVLAPRPWWLVRQEHQDFAGVGVLPQRLEMVLGALLNRRTPAASPTFG